MDIAGANLIQVQTAQASDDRIFNLLMKWKQLEDAGVPLSVINENLPLPHSGNVEESSSIMEKE